MKRLLVFAVFLAASDALALKRMSKDYLICRSRIDCDKVPNLSAPRNALLVNFQDADFTGPFAWIKTEKPAVLRGINQLLKHYGFGITAQEIGESEFQALRTHPDADVILKYRANSFLTVVGIEGVNAHIGGTYINDVDRYQDDFMIYGPTRHPPDFRVDDSDIEYGEVRPVTQMADEKTPAARKRAMLAWTIVHEFVHAAHHRALGTIVSGPPAQGMRPKCVVPYKSADEITSKFVRTLALSRSSGHMARGLMVAGGDHKGNVNDTHGGGTHSIYNCLKDTRVPLALINDLAALAGHEGLCGPFNEYDASDKGFPAKDYFELPSDNRMFISAYLKKMDALSCYAGCYYEVADEATAMKRAGYDMSKYLTLENQVPIGRPQVAVPEAPKHDPRYEPWWKEANRQCAAADRRTAQR